MDSMGNWSGPFQLYSRHWIDLDWTRADFDNTVRKVSKQWKKQYGRNESSIEIKFPLNYYQWCNFQGIALSSRIRKWFVHSLRSTLDQFLLVLFAEFSDSLQFHTCKSLELHLKSRILPQKIAKNACIDQVQVLISYNFYYR